MIDQLQAHLHAMQMLSRAQEVTANNLANINTPGFKGDKLFFRMFTEEVDGRMMSTTVPMQRVIFEQGILEATGNDFDLAINGEGFFMVEDDGNEFLTRNGRFHFDSNGYLRNEQGAQVVGQGGEIHMPEYFQVNENGRANVVTIDTDGTIRLNGEMHDRLRIVKPEHVSQLERRGSNYFVISENGVLDDDPDSKVMQGYYEKGNVDSLSEMVNMMQNMQMFEAQQRALQTTDEMLSQATQRLGQF